MTNYKPCTVEGCTRTAASRGLCRTHYARWRRTGTTELQGGLVSRDATPQQRLEHHGWTVEQRVEGLTPCHIFAGSKDPAGYGMMGVGNSKIQKTHRIALQIKLGRPIAPGMGALHTCDVRACINQDHLYEGTPKDNARDREARGRGRWQKAPAVK